MTFEKEAFFGDALNMVCMSAVCRDKVYDVIEGIDKVCKLPILSMLDFQGKQILLWPFHPQARAKDRCTRP